MIRITKHHLRQGAARSGMVPLLSVATPMAGGNHGKECVMTSSGQATTLGVIVTVLLGALGAPESRADSFYTIRSLNAPIADFVTNGDAVPINVTRASTA